MFRDDRSQWTGASATLSFRGIRQCYLLYVVDHNKPCTHGLNDGKMFGYRRTTSRACVNSLYGKKHEKDTYPAPSRSSERLSWTERPCLITSNLCLEKVPSTSGPIPTRLSSSHREELNQRVPLSLVGRIISRFFRSTLHSIPAPRAIPTAYATRSAQAKVFPKVSAELCLAKCIQPRGLIELAELHRKQTLRARLASETVPPLVKRQHHPRKIMTAQSASPADFATKDGRPTAPPRSQTEADDHNHPERIPPTLSSITARMPEIHAHDCSRPMRRSRSFRSLITSFLRSGLRVGSKNAG